jgi:hypothetical protein
MLKQRRKAVDQVTEVLHAAETALDAALNKTAALAATIPVALVEANLSTLYCQEALEHVSETIAAIAKARRGLVEAHKELTVVKGQIGLGAVTMGGGDSVKPPMIADKASERILQPVRTSVAA